MITIKSLTEFHELIQKEKVFVDFYADWCGPCKMLDMVIAEVEEMEEIPFVRVDCDRFHGIAKEYKVMNVPVCMIFENGKVVRSQSGFMRKEELMEFLHQ